MQTTHMATPVLEVAHLEKVYGALGNVTRALLGERIGTLVTV